MAKKKTTKVKKSKKLELYKKVAEDLNEICGFDVPINLDQSEEQLLEEIKASADSVEMEDELMDETWELFRELSVGPEFAEEEPKEDKKKSKGKASVKKESPEEEEPKEDKKKSPAKKEKKTKKPGVIATIISCLQEGPKTKEEILKVLVEKFPERQEKSMKQTINVQVPGRINKERDFEIEKDKKDRWSVI